MNHKLKRKWCAALRGGTWTQVRRKFYEGENGRCALTVLGEVVDPVANPRITVNDLVSAEHQELIMRMNDWRGKTFSEIADWIEENI